MRQFYSILKIQAIFFACFAGELFAHKTGLQHSHGNGNGNGNTPEIDGNQLVLGLTILVSCYLLYKFRKSKPAPIASA